MSADALGGLVGSGETESSGRGALGSPAGAFAFAVETANLTQPFGLLAVLPHHVQALPAWLTRTAAAAVLGAMAAVALTAANGRWLRIERATITLFAMMYVANTIVELADMIGIRCPALPSCTPPRTPFPSSGRATSGSWPF